MRKSVVLFLAMAFVFAVMSAPASAGHWDKRAWVRDYDSIGVYTIQDDAAGSFTSLDTATTWTCAKNQHNVGDVFRTTCGDYGGDTYTTLYLWAYPTSTPHADSVKGYVCIDQSIGGNAVWTLVDSVSITTASTVAQGAMTLIGAPYFRIRTQGADATDKSTGVDVLVKLMLIK